MGDKKKDEGAGDPIKILLEEALEKQRNVMMDKHKSIVREKGGILSKIIGKWLKRSKKMGHC